MQIGRYLEDSTRRDWQTADDVEPVRLAVVGMGWWTETHALSAIDDSDYCESSVLVSDSPATADRLATEYSVETTIDYDGYHDGDASEEYDAVYVVTPNATHLEFVETAAGLGKDVICEKPLEANADRARRLVDACEDAGVTLMTAYRMQADPAMRRLRELLDDGVVGEPVQLHGGFSFHLVGGLPGQWRRDEAVSGGGSLTDIGVYPLNVARFLLGSDPTEAIGRALTPHEEFDEARDEHAAFQLTFPGAVTASFTSSFREYGVNWLRIFGTEGEVVVEPAFDAGHSREITVDTADERIEYASPETNEVSEQFDYFAHCLATGETPEPDGHDGLTDMRIMEAVYESSDTGSRITL